jgi:hypothetical protein
MTLTADSIKIDTDDGRFILIIDTEEFGKLRVDFHRVALEFEDEVRRELRPYALEASHARATMPESYDDAYDVDDPKHPQYVTTMVDLEAIARLEEMGR